MDREFIERRAMYVGERPADDDVIRGFLAATLDKASISKLLALDYLANEGQITFICKAADVQPHNEKQAVDAFLLKCRNERKAPPRPLCMKSRYSGKKPKLDVQTNWGEW